MQNTQAVPSEERMAVDRQYPCQGQQSPAPFSSLSFALAICYMAIKLWQKQGKVLSYSNASGVVVAAFMQEMQVQIF